MKLLRLFLHNRPMSTHDWIKPVPWFIVRLKDSVDARVKKYEFRGVNIKISSVAAIYKNSSLRFIMDYILHWFIAHDR